MRTVLWLFLMVFAAPRLAGAELVWALSLDNRMVVFAPETPGTIVREIQITGLQPGEILRAIDFRPADSQLYGFGNSQRIYRIHMWTGAATPIGTGVLAIAVDDDDDLGFDFNPVTDEIRIITSASKNFRVSPTTGQVIDGLPGFLGIQGDSDLAPASEYVAAAHSNNFPGAAATTLVAISSSTDRFVRIGGIGGSPSPDLGVVTDIGPLGIATNGLAGLDITLDNQPYAFLSGGGFCFINRGNGHATVLDPIGTLGANVADIAVLSVASTVNVLTEDRRLLRFKRYSPSTILSDVPITGLVRQGDGEALVAIDVRPATGQLYGLGSSGDGMRLYTIDPLTGIATVVGDPQSALDNVPGLSVGMDFDPITDELRLVAPSLMNRRLHPDTLAVTVDANLTKGGVSGLAAANHIAGPSGTFYGLDADGPYLVRIGGHGGAPPASGGVVQVIEPLGVQPPFANGFDMAVVDDVMLVAGQISGDNRLYILDPVSGEDLFMGTIAGTTGAVTGLAIGSPGRVQFEAAAATIGEAGGTVTLTVTRVGTPDGPFSIDYRTDGGSASAGSDYAAASGTLIFRDGETSKTLVLSIINDRAAESSETIEVVLSDPTLGARLGSQAIATVTIQDDEAPPPPPPPPPPSGSYFLAEGATGTFFDLDILLANPNATPIPVTVTFLKEGGSTVVQTLTLPATSRTTLRVDDISGLEDASVSTIVESSVALPLVVERTMRWDASGYGAHTEKATSAPAREWFFAEGSQGFFSTYVLLANPQSTANVATIDYLREGLPPISRTYDLAPLSRRTVDTGADPELRNTSFGMVVRFAQRGVAERAMYFGANPLWKGGHESAGVTEPSADWFLAEGATGSFFETFILLANPDPVATADVTVTYLQAAGAPPITKTKTIAPSSRLTINVEQEDTGLANAAFGTRVSSDVPIVVERAQYWPDPAPAWYEAHNSFGTPNADTAWGLAEGRVGGPGNYQTYILMANPFTADAEVTIVFLRTNGTTVTKTVTLAGLSRLTIAPGPGSPVVPELANEEFGAVITSTQPIVVERAMYLDAGGVVWSAGTNATATRLITNR
jgi:hypothetical protein